MKQHKQRIEQIAAWRSPKAFNYRQSLKHGERLGKDADFINQVLTVAGTVHDEVKEDGGVDYFADYWHAFREGEEEGRAAERAFARALAPLLFGKQADFAKLQRVIDCAKQARGATNPKQQLASDMLKAYTEEKQQARKEPKKLGNALRGDPDWIVLNALEKEGRTLPTIKAVRARYEKNTGKPISKQAAGQSLKKLGALCAQDVRGTDKKDRVKR